MVLHFLKDKSLLCLSKMEYITVLAPTTGVILAISVKAIRKYRQHQNRFNNKIFKFKKPIKTPVYNPIRDGLKRLVILKISYVHGKIILTCSKLNRIIFVIIQKSPIAPLELDLWTKGIWKTTEIVIVCRAGRILFDTGKYLLKNETNVLKTGINTLVWIVNDDAKALVYKLVFLGVSLSTALIWTYVPHLRRILRVWTTITMFNLCSNIVVTDGRQMWLEHGPQVTAFGLSRPPIERIEHPIPEVKINPEQLKSPRVILPGNETELRFSSPTRKKMKSTTFKDVTREHSEISQNSILSEKARIVPTEKEKTKIRLKEEKSLVIQNSILSEKARIVPTEKEKTKIRLKEEKSLVIYEEKSIVANKETTIATTEETTIVTNEEPSIVANEEATIVTNEELRKTNSTSKLKRTIQKSRTNNLQKLNEKFDPSGDGDDDPTSSNPNDNVQDGMNYTKVKAGKVR
jgi:hypothetical protein